LELNELDYEVYNNLVNIQYENRDFEDAMRTNLEMFGKFPQRRNEIFALGQKMAVATHGPKTTYYIDLLLEKRIISPKVYDNLKKQLHPSFMGN